MRVEIQTSRVKPNAAVKRENMTWRSGRLVWFMHIKSYTQWTCRNIERVERGTPLRTFQYQHAQYTVHIAENCFHLLSVIISVLSFHTLCDNIFTKSSLISPDGCHLWKCQWLRWLTRSLMAEGKGVKKMSLVGIKMFSVQGIKETT